MLLECICEKKTHGWLVHEDPYLDRIIRFLNKFDGFNANDYFVLNKPLLIGMLANFVTYFIILVQFSYIWSPQSIKKHKRHLTIFCDFDHLDVFERGNVTINFSFFSPSHNFIYPSTIVVKMRHVNYWGQHWHEIMAQKASHSSCRETFQKWVANVIHLQNFFATATIVIIVANCTQ